MILPAFFDNPRFISLGATFILPFVVFTFLAIFKHGFLNVRVITTEVVAFLLSIATLIEFIIAKNPIDLWLRFGVFVLVLVFSILLVKSVLKEVRQREELARLNTQLDQLSKFKSQLLSIASHQIKAPLAAIKGYASLVLDGSYGDANGEVKVALGKIKYSADDLINLVNTLLDLRKVEEGKMDYQFAKTDLNKLVSEVFELLRPLADSKKLEFTLSLPDKEILVNADAEKLKQVIQNLIDNAIKYTPTGFVRVELKEENGLAHATVSDSGYGIGPNLLPQVFDEFTRDERVKKEIRGTGLGLYIARKIIEAHNGKIWAESAGENKGSTFHVSIATINNV